jgi:hypothetical protein
MNRQKNKTANPQLAAQLARDVGADRTRLPPANAAGSARPQPLRSATSPPPTRNALDETRPESPEETMLSRNREALLRQLEKDYLLKLQDWNRE